MYKKKFFNFLLFICAASNAQVREILEAVKPKKEFTGIPVLQKKSQALSVTVGAPNNVANFLNFGGVASFFFTTTAKKSSGPFMIDYEYFIKDNVGIGLSLLHASARQTYQAGNTSYTGSIKQYQIGFSTYYHLYTTDKLDPYIKGTVGINIWDGYYKDNNGNDAENFVAPAPFGFRSIIGLRYFAAKKFAITGEANLTLLPRVTVAANIGVALKMK
jgi:hypothetical protein